jgi:RimJ/RimL family protein N-acetyltransferase
MIFPGAERAKRAVQPPRSRVRWRVREARAGDIGEMVLLLGHLFRQESDFVPAPAKQRRALESILSHPTSGRLFVLTRGSKVVGMVSLLFTISTAEGGKAAWLEDMIIAPGHRNRGLGTRLLRAALAWAEQDGITRVSLLTDSDNLRAQRYYLRHGFVSSGMQPFRLHLPHKASTRVQASQWT